MLKDVYMSQIENKYECAEPGQSADVVKNGGAVQNVNSVGIYVLTLNKHMMVRHFELVYLSDVKSSSNLER
jgi:hypothetical protein